VSERSVRQRLEVALDELVAAELSGRTRDAASWRIAVDVLRDSVESQAS